jgi:TonB family protein
MIMKTQNLQKTTLNLILPLILCSLIAFQSCVAGKKSAKTQTMVETASAPTPSAVSPATTPPQKPSRLPRFVVIGTDTVYTYLKDMPQFPGGIDALQKFKTENIKYPPEVKSLGIEGIVIIGLMIEKDGAVSDIQVLMGASPSLDSEAIRVARLMPEWQPARVNGKPVKFRSVINFEFALTPRVPQAHKEGEPFVVVEEMPLFPGGDSTLLAFISKNIVYPENAKKNNIQGRVILRFCITESGSVDRVSILQGVDDELDAEAIRVVKSLPAFKPGKQGGKPVPVWYMVPISLL